MSIIREKVNYSYLENEMSSGVGSPSALTKKIETLLPRFLYAMTLDEILDLQHIAQCNMEKENSNIPVLINWVLGEIKTTKLEMEEISKASTLIVNDQLDEAVSLLSAIQDPRTESVILNLYRVIANNYRVKGEEQKALTIEAKIRKN